MRLRIAGYVPRLLRCMVKISATEKWQFCFQQDKVLYKNRMQPGMLRHLPHPHCAHTQEIDLLVCVQENLPQCSPRLTLERSVGERTTEQHSVTQGPLHANWQRAQGYREVPVSSGFTNQGSCKVSTGSLSHAGHPNHCKMYGEYVRSQVYKLKIIFSGSVVKSRSLKGRS